MKQNFFYVAFYLAFAFLLTGCTPDDAMSEYEHTEAYFSEGLGCQIGTAQWWETTVKLQVEVVTDAPAKIWLLSNQENGALYDYKEVEASGTVMMTAPQGQGNTLKLNCMCQNRLTKQTVTLSGKAVETVSLNTQKSTPAVSPEGKNHNSGKDHPVSLCGNSVAGNGEQCEFNSEQLESFRNMMGIMSLGGSYLDYLGDVSDNYELLSKGPFYLIWTSGWEAYQTPHILGYYYHSPGTYEDIVYVDLSETHKWDYIDGFSKVQYQIDFDDDVAGMHFNAGEWYDANFDMYDVYDSNHSLNMDRLGDNAFNMHAVYNRYGQHISALRGLAFLVDVPAGKHIGMYLRSESEPYPGQWERVRAQGVPPYVNSPALFRGTCFSAHDLNVDNARRSIIWDGGPAIWMGMEDFVVGGDNDCDDVVFCVLEDMDIYKPEIITPDMILDETNLPFPWTLAFEDVYREADFDFNDAVIRLVPDYDREVCCVTAMAVGATEQMYLYYDGPAGEVCLGEMHELMGNANTSVYINTQQSNISTAVVPLDCVPWPKTYTMDQDARRFSIRVKRGTCEDCADTLSLPSTPGKLPEALLVAGEWNWPKEGVSIVSAYPYFSTWSHDPTLISSWEWYKNANINTSVSY